MDDALFAKSAWIYSSCFVQDFFLRSQWKRSKLLESLPFLLPVPFQDCVISSGPVSASQTHLRIQLIGFRRTQAHSHEFIKEGGQPSEKPEPSGRCSDMAPKKFLNSRIPEMAFPAF